MYVGATRTTTVIEDILTAHVLHPSLLSRLQKQAGPGKQDTAAKLKMEGYHTELEIGYMMLINKTN